jgi:NADPH2:quinone reductase
LLAKAAADINSLLAENRLKHQIAARFPLDRIVEAHEMQESGRTIGKILIDIADLG